MKFYLTFIILLSCSTTSPLNTSQISTRGPDSLDNEKQCGLLMAPFNGPKISFNTKEELVNNGILKNSDLEILEENLMLNSLPENDSEKKEIEISYLLIKKQFPHFGPEQIIGHYQLLKEFCGM